MENNIIINQMRDCLINEWGGWITRVYDNVNVSKIHSEIPQIWQHVADNSSANMIEELWDNARSVLPRFVDYLNQSTLAIAVADGSIGPILVYYIKDWEETEIGEYKDGFMLAGLPTSVESIHVFEKSVGKIPASLKCLWQVHGFILIKSGSVLSSLDSTLEQFCGYPTILGSRKAPSNPEEKYECLAIADVWKELPVCLTRNPGNSDWDDFVVIAERDGDEVTPSVRTRIDDLLADWTFSEWVR